jgi:hypothetical protein
LEQIQPDEAQLLLGNRPDQNTRDQLNPYDDSYLDYIPNFKTKMKIDSLYNSGIDPSIKQWKHFNDKSHEVDYSNPLEMQKYRQDEIFLRNNKMLSFFPPNYRGGDLIKGKSYGSYKARKSKTVKMMEQQAKKQNKVETSGKINILKQLVDSSWVLKNPYSIKSYSNNFITSKSYLTPIETVQFPSTNFAKAF